MCRGQRRREKDLESVFSQEYHFKEGMVFKKSKERNFVYTLAGVMDSELDSALSQMPESLSVDSLVSLMMGQKPEVLVDGE